MIVFDNVGKKYADVIGLDGASFNVEKGELFGLIGPDGAGKSTAMRMLVTLLLPDSGSITFNNLDVVGEYKTIRKSVGYMPGNFALYSDLTVEENLTFFASVFNTTIEENYHLVKDIYEQLAPFKDRRAGALSGGMKQKLALCCALIHKPLALVLDEPTTGVDAVSRMEFWNMLRAQKENGITILVSTPYLEEASLCDRVGLINDGKLLQIGSPTEIVASYPNRLWSVVTGQQSVVTGHSSMVTGHSSMVIDALRKWPNAHAVYLYRSKVMVSTDAGVSQTDIETYLNNAGVQFELIESAQPDIEDCFMNLMSAA